MPTLKISGDATGALTAVSKVTDAQKDLAKESDTTAKAMNSVEKSAEALGDAAEPTEKFGTALVKVGDQAIEAGEDFGKMKEPLDKAKDAMGDAAEGGDKFGGTLDELGAIGNTTFGKIAKGAIGLLDQFGLIDSALQFFADEFQQLTRDAERLDELATKSKTGKRLEQITGGGLAGFAEKTRDPLSEQGREDIRTLLRALRGGNAEYLGVEREAFTEQQAPELIREEIQRFMKRVREGDEELIRVGREVQRIRVPGPELNAEAMEAIRRLEGIANNIEALRTNSDRPQTQNTLSGKQE